MDNEHFVSKSVNATVRDDRHPCSIIRRETRVKIEPKVEHADVLLAMVGWKHRRLPHLERHRPRVFDEFGRGGRRLCFGRISNKVSHRQPGELVLRVFLEFAREVSPMS